MPAEKREVKKEKLSPTMLSYVGLRICVTLDDDTKVDGTLASFDKHGNMILTDAERTRTTKAGAPVRQAIPVVMLRGQGVLSIEHTPSIATSAGIVTSYIGTASGSGGLVGGSRRPATAAVSSKGPALNTPLQLS